MVKDQVKNIRFVRFGDLVLIDECSLGKLGLDEESIKDLKQIEKLKDRFKCNRIALKSCIQNDAFRSPTVTLLEHNLNPWVIVVENSIKYMFNITKSMFCKGMFLFIHSIQY